MTESLYNVQQVANYFLERAEEEERPLTPLKLLKLVYFAYGWVLALTGKRLFDDEIQAWQHGPVVPALYHEFKHYRSEPIMERSACFDLDSFAFSVPEIPSNDHEIRLILSRVWDAYKHFSGWALRNMTHAAGSPWHTVYNDGERGIAIRDVLIKQHFAERIGEYLDGSGTA